MADLKEIPIPKEAHGFIALATAVMAMLAITYNFHAYCCIRGLHWLLYFFTSFLWPFMTSDLEMLAIDGEQFQDWA